MNKFEQKILDLCEMGTELLTKYTTAKTKVELQCANGHTRSIIPSNMFARNNGTTCKQCEGKQVGKKSHTKFLSEVYEKYPNLIILGEYIGAKVPIEVSCISGHSWEVLPTNLLSRDSDGICYKCNPQKVYNRYSLEEAQQKIQDNYPFLSLIEYNTSLSHSLVLDNRCGATTRVLSGNLIGGRGFACSSCEADKHGVSAMELRVVDFIKQNYNGWIELSNKDITYPKELDIVLPDLGIAVEVNGVYFHREEAKGKDYHIDKTKAVEAVGFQLIHIFEDEWLYKQEIVKSRLLSLLGKNSRLYARNLSVKEISFPSTFLANNHLQGVGSPCSINYGLFDNDILVAAMCFSKPRFDNTHDYELVRYCCSLGYNIVGGASKLLKAFTRAYPDASIVSYSDKRWSVGKLYSTLGFTLSHSSAPNYKYYKGLKSLSRYTCQKHKLKQLFPDTFQEELSEQDIMRLNGYYRVFDCGNDVWTLNHQ